jgi:hypothetical protein
MAAIGVLSGFVIGKNRFAWPALVVSGVVLALLAAFVLQRQGFTSLPGIFIIVACLVVNQVAHVLATRLNDHQRGRSARDSAEQRTNSVPSDDRHDDVRHEDKGDQNAELHRRLAGR